MGQHHLVFVYGTLKRGACNHHLLAGAQALGARQLRGARLHDLGPYPMAVLSGERDALIHGELYRVDGAGLQRLDVLEDYPREYNRSRVRLSDGTVAWLYHGRPAQVASTPLIASGHWGPGAGPPPASGDNGATNRPVPMSAAPANPAYGALTTEGNSTNIAWHQAAVTRDERAQQRGHRSAILWFTGLSGAGKSTLANAVNAALFEQGLACYVLDGDNIRHGLCKDLGFSDADREENIRRIGEVAKLFVDAGVVALTAFVSPFKADRDKVRALVPAGDFIEIHCAADLAVCEQRDTKGLYAKARAGAIKEFTGISSPYEAPDNPELRVDTGSQSLEASVAQVLSHLQAAGIIPQAS